MDTYKYTVYRYAPESFKAWVNGIPIPLTHSQVTRLGSICICKSNGELLHELRAVVRELREEPRRCVFGFFKAGSDEFCYTRQLIACNNDLASKLSCYKAWKQYVIDNNYKLCTHIISTGEFDPYGENKGTEEEVCELVDIKRPIKIYFKKERI